MVTGRAEKVATPGFSWAPGRLTAHSPYIIMDIGESIKSAGTRISAAGKLLSKIRLLLNILIIISWMDVSWRR